MCVISMNVIRSLKPTDYLALLLYFFGTQNIDGLAPSLVQAVFTMTNDSILSFRE